MIARAHRIAVRHPLVAIGFLAAFAGVRLAADAVHRDRERGMRLARDRAVGHGAGREALDDRDRRSRPPRAARAGGRPPRPCWMRNRPRIVSSMLALLVEQLGVGVVLVAGVAAHRVLQQRHRLRRPDMRLAAQAIGVFAADLERRCAAPANRRTRRRAGARSPAAISARPTPSMRRRGAGEVLVDEGVGEADRVEDLRAAIGLVGRDAHLGHDLEHALVDRLDEALDDLVAVDLLGQVARPSRSASRRRDRD